MKKKLSLLILFITGCLHGRVSPQNQYPDTWWTIVPQSELKVWEIPPQAADRNKFEVILSKRTELGQFSNLAETPFEMDGVKYKSIEGLWQGMKYPENSQDERLKDPRIVWPFRREQVYQLSSFEAKKAGDIANENMKKLGIKYITYQGKKIEYNGSGVDRHYEIILKASRLKISQNPELEKLLLSTKGLTFFPDHKQQPHPTPAYLYHQIYMKIRDEL